MVGCLGFMAYHPCRLGNAKSILYKLSALFQIIQFTMSTQFDC